MIEGRVMRNTAYLKRRLGGHKVTQSVGRDANQALVSSLSLLVGISLVKASQNATSEFNTWIVMVDGVTVEYSAPIGRVLEIVEGLVQ